MKNINTMNRIFSIMEVVLTVMMNNMRNSMMKKNPLIMKPTDTVVRAARKMLAHGVSALLVQSDIDGSLGIVTESDIVRRVVARGASAQTTELCVVMTQNPQTVCCDDGADCSEETLQAHDAHGLRRSALVE